MNDEFKIYNYIIKLCFICFCCGVLFACTDKTIRSNHIGVGVTLHTADQGDGTYVNPIIHADYSDPDVIRVGDDFYMTASSFTCTPGLPILHSKDLITWQLIGHAVKNVTPEEHYQQVHHGCGIWAPSLRYQNGMYYIFYGDPDFGVYVLKSETIDGGWSQPLLIEKTKGWIDPCPLWDDDGKLYLVHAYAGSRAGIKSILAVSRLSADGSKIIDDGVIVFDGHAKHPTIEGPKFYKRDGYYYIFAPAGGVTHGWQTVLRSKNIYGPYKDKIVMHQGASQVNGPHQGAWVHLESNEDWFIHFQDKEAFGRIIHLQPMTWNNHWPIIGENIEGIGVPVRSYQKPTISNPKVNLVPDPMDNEFNGEPYTLWQWNTNKDADWGMCFQSESVYRIFCQQLSDTLNGLNAFPSLFLQKFPANTFEVQCKIHVHLLHQGERCGIVIMGSEYCCLEFFVDGGNLFFATIFGGKSQKTEQRSEPLPIEHDDVILRLMVDEDAICKLSYSVGEKDFIQVVNNFQAKPGRWIGAKFGFYAIKSNHNNDSGWLDVDWVRYQ